MTWADINAYVGINIFCMQDKEIVALYLKRDESAVLETQKKYDPYLRKIAYNILADEGDCGEIVNDTYLGAWRSIPPHIPTVLSTYLAKLTRRLAIDTFRRRNRKKRHAGEFALSLSELSDCVSEGNVVEGKIDETLLKEAINSYLRTLPKEERVLFIGRYFYLDSLNEVASYCGMSVSKAKSMLYRTRCGLKEYLRKEGFFI
uniref:RNA polymerase sigma factor n=1 Tax=Agathobacter sp. TaxID=2021311 RepID=UPI004057A97A